MAAGGGRSIMVDRVLLELLVKATGSLTTAMRLLRKAIGEKRERCPSMCRIMHLTKAEVSVVGRQIECFVPIAPGSAWHSGEITIEGVEVPDTVMQACVGRPLSDLVAHPLLPDMTITAWDIRRETMTIRAAGAFVDIGTLRPGASDRLASVIHQIVDPVTRLRIYIRDYLDAVRRVRRLGRPACDSGLSFLVSSAFMLLVACALAPGLRHATTTSMLMIGILIEISLCLFAMLIFAAVDTHYGYPSNNVNGMPCRLTKYRDALDAVQRHHDGR